MARLTDNVRAMLGSAWDLVRGAANLGLTATETVSMTADVARGAGMSLSFSESSAVATLYGYARRMFNAAEVVQSLGPSDVIGPDAISTPPWARDETEMATLPMWHVHFDFTYTDQEGNQQTDRRVSVFRMTFFDTMGELQDALEADAQAMAAKYGVTFVQADIKEIHSV